jgi:enamine deaminase RidA (YjgF/YER057c/UK114 family)
VFGFSRAVRVGNLIAVAGTAAIAPDGTPACPGDPAWLVEIEADAVVEG